MSLFETESPAPLSGATALAKIIGVDPGQLSIVLGQVNHVRRPIGLNLIGATSIQDVHSRLGLRRDTGALTAQYIFSR